MNWQGHVTWTEVVMLCLVIVPQHLNTQTERKCNPGHGNGPLDKTETRNLNTKLECNPLKFKIVVYMVDML
jgi:hypothetical protein